MHIASNAPGRNDDHGENGLEIIEGFGHTLIATRPLGRMCLNRVDKVRRYAY